MVPTFAEVVADDAPATIAADIPIGLLDFPTPGGRLCDVAARLVVGMRTSSVFTPPARIALGARTYEEAKRLCSMSRQSYGLLRRIAEVDAILTPEAQSRIIETHPEVAFAALSGHPWLSSKKTPAGRRERTEILAPLIPGVERLARRRERGLHVDDVLDACAAAVVAARHRLGQARTLPPDPPRDVRGLRMAIWY